MASHKKPTEMQFILTDSMGKTEPTNRKLIRKHVMLGKNRGKTRAGKAKATTAYNSKDQDRHPGLLITMRYPKIPNKVGSELSFTQFAGPVEQPLLHNVLKFSFMAKRIMYPLESCIIFHGNAKADTSWFELLTSDAVYMHAIVFTSQAYISIASSRNDPIATKAALFHYSEVLRLLHERMSTSQVSDPTVLAVLYLALHAHFTNDYDTAKHHIDGLRKIVDMRGGLNSFSYNTKIIIELLKCDLGIALNNGTQPTFLKNGSSDPLMQYDLAQFGRELPDSSDTKSYWEMNQLSISADLAQAWDFLNRFCSTITSATEHKRQLPKDILLNTMAPLMYRLLSMTRFEPTSLDEAIRLGLLVFSSHIFLSWQGIKIPLTHISYTYRSCLINPKLPSILPSRLLLWLLMIGYLSIFTPADDTWLMPWIRANIDLCNADSWDELRGQLKPFPWIHILHDKPGQEIFDAAMLCGNSGTRSI